MGWGVVKIGGIVVIRFTVLESTLGKIRQEVEEAWTRLFQDIGNRKIVYS